VAIVTLLTDFGLGSPYVAALKGVLLSINPALTLVDLTHAVRPQDIRQAALVLADVAPRFPAGTIHVAVVDPGVGTARQIVYAEIGVQRFVCPNNGLLSNLARRQPPQRCVAVTEPRHWLSPVAATFHGRDIMAPVAARLSLGLDPAELGPMASNLLMLDEPPVRRTANALEGVIVQIDSFGNLISNIGRDAWQTVPTAGRSIVCAGETTTLFGTTYADQPPGTLVGLFDSQERLELAVVNGSAADRLGAKVGDTVTVAWGKAEE